MTTWEPGLDLGRYVLERQLGAGGMGEVWKALDRRLDRAVALKRLKGEHTARFEHEARAIAALNHPHICQIHDVGPDYLVLEYVEGSPLKGPMPVEEAARIAIQVASALEEAHRRSILHRDLKPANILLTVQGSAKLLDFGLAKLISPSGSLNPHDDTATRTGAVMGTVSYMSPEQAQGFALDERSDIFSFGAVLYELLAGIKAFDGRSMAESLTGVLRDEPRPLNAPEPIARIVTRCLRKDARERFQSATELRTALENLSSKPAEAATRSIAVLPFANIGSDPENEYFSDGLAEEILNLLSRMDGLKVIARTSAFAFKGQNTDVRRIAETLGVTHILEGGVRKAGGRIRVTAQLIAAADGTQLWSDRYDRTLEDIFSVQDEIGQAIASALQAKLATASAIANPTRHGPDLAAYEAFLKGRHHTTSSLTPEATERAQRHYEQALEIDPQFALAHVGLAYVVLMRAMMALMPAHEAMRVARMEARQALEIEPDLGEAHAMLGVIAGVYDYDWREAGRRFNSALRSGHTASSTRASYGFFYLLYLGRTAEAVDELTKALQEDPLNVQVRFQRAVAMLWSGRDEEAIAELHEVLDLTVRFPAATMALAVASTAKGNFKEALAWAEKAGPEAASQALPGGILAGLKMRNGEGEEARSLLVALDRDKTYGASVGQALYHLVTAEFDQAADWALKAMDERHPGIPYFLQSPLARELRAGARWPELARKMNLPSGTTASTLG